MNVFKSAFSYTVTIKRFDQEVSDSPILNIVLTTWGGGHVYKGKSHAERQVTTAQQQLNRTPVSLLTTASTVNASGASSSTYLSHHGN